MTPEQELEAKKKELELLELEDAEAAVAPPTPAKPPSEIESAARGGLQGATLNYSDEGAGVLDALLAAAKKGGVGDIPEDYRAGRDESRAANAAAEAANPKSYLAGEFGGGAATMLVPGAGEITAAKLAALGAMQGMGASEGDLTKGEVGQAALDTGKGAAVGLAVGKVGEAVAPYIGKGVAALKRGGAGARDYLRDLAEEYTLRAMNFGKGMRAKMGAMGEEKMQDVARTALDQGVVTPLAGTEKMLSRAEELGGAAGENIGTLLKSLEESGVGTGLTRPALMQRFREELGDTMSARAFPDVFNKLDKILGSDRRGPLSFHELQEIKTFLQETALKHGETIPGSKEILGRASGIVREELEKAVDAGARALGDTGEAAISYLENKGISGQASEMEGALTRKRMGELAAPSPLAHPWDAASKAIEDKSAQIVATGADWLGDMVRSAPQKLGRYAQVLQQAAQRGAQALASSHFVLQQTDEEYRKKIKELQDDGEAEIQGAR